MHRSSRLPLVSASKHKKRPLGFYDKALPPPNPRYAHVGSRIDSGPTVAKLRTITARQFVRRKEETFARVTPGQLAALAAEYGCGYDGGCCGSASEPGEQEGDGCVSSGGSSVVVVTHDPTRNAPAYDKPYLLVDVRPDEPEEASEKTRLVESRRLPPHLLRQDRIPSDILRFKNREGTLLILYDQRDGAPPMAGAMATELVLRGWENVYVLSGGLDAVAGEHPHLVDGRPSPPQQEQQPRRGRTGEESDPLRLSEANLARLPLALEGKAKGEARSGTAASVGSSFVSVHGGKSKGGGGARMRMTTDGGAPSVLTTGTSLSVAKTVIARAQARKGMF